MAPKPDWSQDDVFPIINDVIFYLYQKQADRQPFITHDEIVDVLVRDEAAVKEIRRVKAAKPHKSQWDIAANMVAWFSQRITMGETHYGSVFDRTIIDRRYAYRPKPSKMAYRVRDRKLIDPRIAGVYVLEEQDGLFSFGHAFRFYHDGTVTEIQYFSNNRFHRHAVWTEEQWEQVVSAAKEKPYLISHAEYRISGSSVRLYTSRRYRSIGKLEGNCIIVDEYVTGDLIPGSKFVRRGLD